MVTSVSKIHVKPVTIQRVRHNCPPQARPGPPNLPTRCSDTRMIRFTDRGRRHAQLPLPARDRGSRDYDTGQTARSRGGRVSDSARHLRRPNHRTTRPPRRAHRHVVGGCRLHCGYDGCSRRCGAVEDVRYHARAGWARPDRGNRKSPRISGAERIWQIHHDSGSAGTVARGRRQDRAARR